ncbi:uncharacterized protein LOC124172774 [Ischnura elegans]|uniref:uncharacterized protein LOC124171302 n=1 Tax=Ischnura elegans TaxID=197161 RepID=UPI001ED8B062|nr:uncharacterized protein LOC124171302 [Ischnura elegans]XP_046408219.1 uncharacterized protein LOC124172774 [Ischnura elegans]
MKEEIIIAVQSRPALWDKRNKHHHNRHVLDKEWKAVAAALNCTDKDVKLIWKNLRDEFRKQYSKTPRSGDAAPDSTSSWKFFDSMLFLRDQFVPRKSTGNLTDLSNDTNFDEGQLNDDFVEEQVDSLSVMDNEEGDRELTQIDIPSTPNQSGSNNSSPTPTLTSKRTTEEYTRTGYKKRLTNQAKIGQELVNIEKEKLKLKLNKVDEVNKNDEDVGFFNSLLPHVKTLDPRKKMMFRMKVQELLFDMAYSPEQEPSYKNRPSNPAMSHRYEYYPHTETSSFAHTSSHTPTPLTSPDIEEQHNVQKFTNM